MSNVQTTTFIHNDLNQTIAYYENAVEQSPQILSNYWHLGLAQLLNQDEVNAQTTWMTAILESDDPDIAVVELSELLDGASRELQLESRLGDAWLIRQHLRELQPENVDNLLSLLQLSARLDRLTEVDLENWSVVPLFQSELSASWPSELVVSVVSALLDVLPLTETVLSVIQACGNRLADPTFLMPVLLPKAIRFAYSDRQILAAIALTELYLTWDPGNTEVLAHLSPFYQNSQQYDRGIEVARRRLELTIDLPDRAFSNHLLLRGLLGAGGYWNQAQEVFRNQEQLLLEVANSDGAIQPIAAGRLISCNYHLAYFRDDFQRQRQIQNAVIKRCEQVFQIKSKEAFERYKINHQLRLAEPRVNYRPLRIGYLSHCMNRHSVGWLARWLIEHHDRERIVLYGYFLNPRTNDPLQEWYMEQFDHVRSLNLGEDAQIMAEQINQDEVDILVDLDSITLDTSCEILSLKPAPIQVTWLGWDASGLSAIDYFIADPYVITEDAQPHYQEKIWRLPETYLAIDGFEVDIPTLHREGLKIPIDAIVYMSAQRGYKRHIDTVKLQMQIVKQVPNSYFLIKGFANQSVIQSFFSEIAVAIGVNPDRLRFLPDTPSEAIHRANLAIADVILDTFPYNGATTTMEALWMERPLVTLVGQQFAARNSYTMMMNAGITEGISWTPEEYVAWGIRLGTEPELRQQVAWKLRQSKQSAPLWNGKAFARQMEAAYTAMYQKYLDQRVTPI
jgi:predicted O-linked N-acetylglucosamine transferase (SPINDLY family)